MAAHPEPTLDDHLWTIAAARLAARPATSHVQAPPNLAYDDFPRLLDAGIDDWGGVSPVTIDHVNPEAPWPERRPARARRRGRAGSSSRRGCRSTPSTSPAELARPGACCRRRCARSDALGLAREDGWHPGEPGAVPFVVRRDALPVDTARRARRGGARAPLPRARRRARARLRRRRPAAPRGLRRRGHLRRHAQHPVHERLLLPLRLLRLLEGQARGEPARRAVPRPARRDRPPLRARRGSAARPRSACRAASTRRSPATTTCRSSRRSGARCPSLHVHAFSALEVWQGAATLGLPLEEYLARLRDARPRLAARHGGRDPRRRGAARHLPRQGHDRRSGSTVHEAAHRVGLRSNVTIMFGHVEGPRALGAAPAAGARAAARSRAASPSSCRSRSCTWRRRCGCKGRARSGPTFGETLLVHAVARLALHPGSRTSRPRG